MRLPPILAAAAALVVGAAWAATAFAQSSERFLIHPPIGWQTVPGPHERNVAVARMLPPGTTPGDANEFINVERYDGLKESPRAFAESIVAGNRKNCEGMQVSPIDERHINGYPAAALRFACTKSLRTGKSGLMMVVVVSGTEALHVVQRMWLGPPVAPNQAVPVPDTTIASWDAFASAITLCDANDRHHPCPSN